MGFLLILFHGYLEGPLTILVFLVIFFGGLHKAFLILCIHTVFTLCTIFGKIEIVVMYTIVLYFIHFKLNKKFKKKERNSKPRCCSHVCYQHIQYAEIMLARDFGIV